MELTDPPITLLACGLLQRIADAQLMGEKPVPCSRQFSPRESMSIVVASPSAITQEQLEGLLHKAPGLLIGPGATLRAGSPQPLADAIAQAFAVPPCTDWWQASALALAAGHSPQDIRDAIRDSLAAQPAHESIDAITKVRWRAVLTTSLDAHFEERFQAWMAANPIRGTVTTISTPGQAAPQRTTPVFKLLGSVRDPDFIVSQNEYRLRRQRWQPMLAGFADRVKGAAVLCLGMSDYTDILLDMMAEMIVDRRTTPGSLILLDDDAIARENRLADLASQGLKVHVLAGSVSAFASAFREVVRQGGTLPLAFEKSTITPSEELLAFNELVAVVNNHVTTDVQKAETHRLHDLLFAPTTPRWDAFVHRLDFPRTINTKLDAAITDALARVDNTPYAISLEGPSATGKTTILKRAALDFAQRDHLVLWFRPYFYQDAASELRRFLRQLHALGSSSKKPVVVFVDDPIGLGTLRLHDLRGALEEARIPAVLVIAVRTADMEMLDRDLSLGAAVQMVHIEVPDRFDEQELKALPPYLVRLEIDRDEPSARTRLVNAPTAGSDDVLSMLFLLLRETRASIKSSVRDEYLRLGDRNRFTQVLIGAVNHTSALLKDAYGLVACAGKYGTGVPLEVLVATLGVDYNEWLNAANAEGLAWGLLYEDMSESAETVVYRCRNAVVNDIIVHEVNGGSISRSGEVNGLRRLLSACTGTAPAYREFCVRILVSQHDGPLHTLDFDQGESLFEAAIGALPYEDPSLLHHMGNWERRKGRLFGKARQTLKAALKASPYPYAARTEQPEHIFTTLAANARDAIRSGDLSLDEGTQEALGYLERARRAQYIDPHATHVQAGLIAELADLRNDASSPDVIGLIDHALSDVDRMLVLLRSPFVQDEQRRRDLLMLEHKRSEILDRCLTDQQLEPIARQMWAQHHRVDGFVLVARRALGRAMTSNRGGDFKTAHDFCEEIRQLAESQDVPTPRTIIEVQLHTDFQWWVRRRIESEGSQPIDWDHLRELAERLVEPGQPDDPFYWYVLALASAHLHDWSTANAVFERLRTSDLPKGALWEPRDYFMGERGSIRRVQGTVREAADKRNYLHVQELDQDFLMDHDRDWARDGQIDHGYIHFRFAGPRAVRQP